MQFLHVDLNTRKKLNDDFYKSYSFFQAILPAIGLRDRSVPLNKYFNCSDFGNLRI